MIGVAGRAISAGGGGILTSGGTSMTSSSSIPASNPTPRGATKNTSKSVCTSIAAAMNSLK
jgi:hypothetical protein